MPNIKLIVTGILVFLFLIFFFSAVYTVDQREQVVITQFGEPIRVVKDPGLHIKTPIIQQATSFEKRVME